VDEPANMGRDEKGRFASGGAGGPGRSKGKGYELLQAAQDAVSPEHMRAIMRKATLMALGGNLGAMRFVAERVIGRAPEAPSEAVPLDIEMPQLRTIDDCVKAIDRVTDAMVRGAIPPKAADALISVIGIRVKAIETKDLERRIVELEQAASAVDLPGRAR